MASLTIIVYDNLNEVALFENNWLEDKWIRMISIYTVLCQGTSLRASFKREGQRTSDSEHLVDLTEQCIGMGPSVIYT